MRKTGQAFAAETIEFAEAQRFQCCPELPLMSTQTAPVVQRIFERAAKGDSSWKIALDLNVDGIIPR